MYEVIRQKKPPREVYARRLAEEGVAGSGEAEQLMRARMGQLETELEFTEKLAAEIADGSLGGVDYWRAAHERFLAGEEAQPFALPTE